MPLGLFSLDVTVRLSFACHEHRSQERRVLTWVMSFRKTLPEAEVGYGRGFQDKCRVALGFTHP